MIIMHFRVTPEGHSSHALDLCRVFPAGHVLYHPHYLQGTRFPFAFLTANALKQNQPHPSFHFEPSPLSLHILWQMNATGKGHYQRRQRNGTGTLLGLLQGVCCNSLSLSDGILQSLFSGKRRRVGRDSKTRVACFLGVGLSEPPARWHCAPSACLRAGR